MDVVHVSPVFFAYQSSWKQKKLATE